MPDSKTPELITVFQRPRCPLEADTCEGIVLAWLPAVLLREAGIQELGVRRNAEYIDSIP
jgi:hypothetical protein